MPLHPALGPRAPMGYAAHPLDRAAHLRRDDAALEALRRDPRCGTYLFADAEQVLMRTGETALFVTDEAFAMPHSGQVFLGLVDGAPRFALAVDGKTVTGLGASSDRPLVDLRTIATQGLLPDADLAALAEAKALLFWHRRNRFCPNCGQPTHAVDAGWRRDCPGCATQHFPRTDPVAIMLTIDGDDCLLGRNARFPSNFWSCLAGFIEPGETIEDAVRRETLEEAGIVCGEVRYFASQPWPFPSSLMIGCHARALTRDVVVDTSELAEARWFPRGEVIQMLARQHPGDQQCPRPLAIAHHIIRHWAEGDIVFA